ncbi:MAG: hypothetical protein ACLFTK_14660 [Anaerolineales bacterium]
MHIWALLVDERGDMQCTGLRPVLRHVGLQRSSVVYQTKQNWPEWVAAAERAGL